jgi:coenzyme F420 hydrogenase subunit beta
MRQSDSLEKIVDRHLCMGCGACAAARPDLISMVDTETHGRRPKISKRTSAATSRFAPAQDYDEAAWGPVLEVWEGHATDPELRFRGSSGGVVSALALHGVESGSAAGAVQVAARRDQPLLNETVISRSRADVLAASASRYSPASPCEKLAEVRSNGNPHIFVGKPCDVDRQEFAREYWLDDLDLLRRYAVESRDPGTDSVVGHWKRRPH